ncbi:MAG: hypothetical protein LBC79_02745 [Deltaproteobacteria bacterium]|jgi:hypothetical protein|nr:hypothetical protein [Deltaproteobacteria bacterium]
MIRNTVLAILLCFATVISAQATETAKNDSPFAAATVPGLVIIGGGLLRFFFERWDKRKRDEFEIYHNLIKELVEPNPQTEKIYLDRQIAIVFELRNYKRYYEVSLRIIKDNLADWESYQRLLTEAKLTINYVEKFENLSWCERRCLTLKEILDIRSTRDLNPRYQSPSIPTTL